MDGWVPREWWTFRVPFSSSFLILWTIHVPLYIFSHWRYTWHTAVTQSYASWFWQSIAWNFLHSETSMGAYTSNIAKPYTLKSNCSCTAIYSVDLQYKRRYFWFWNCKLTVYINVQLQLHLTVYLREWLFPTNRRENFWKMQGTPNLGREEDVGHKSVATRMQCW